MKSYTVSLKQFISGQHVSTGLRITVCVLLPAVVLGYYGLLATMMAIPLGALFIALTDQPGPLHHRINGMIAGIFLNCTMVCIAGASAGYEWLLLAEIIVFSFLFALSGIYGPRADGIGLIALLSFIISYGALGLTDQHFIYTALYFAAGGAWYALFSIITNTIRPYRPAAQMLGEYLINISEYLQQRTAFYRAGADIPTILQQLFPWQVKIQQQQAGLRELLFKTRLFVKSPTNKGRRLMMIFLESGDLLERIMTAQQDYNKLHTDFDDSGILKTFHHHLQVLANALLHTGLAVQNEKAYSNAAAIDYRMQQTRQAFLQLRQQQLNASTVSAFIRLRQVLNSIEDVGERIKRLQRYTMPSEKVSRTVRKEEISPFTTSQNFNTGLLLSNLSLNSSHFRHALRFTIAMTAGFIISLLFELGHSYWILLTIATILKPSFSISRKRNMERIIGTFIGAGLAFAVLYFVTISGALVAVMIAAMLVAYTFLRVNNAVSTAAITLYVVVSFHFLYPVGVGEVLQDRVVDTIIGALIALPASYFILPHWEHKNIQQLFSEAMDKTGEYFRSVAHFFSVKNNEAWLQYKLSRKEAFIALANVSDALQRMLTEPKNKQEHVQEYHQLVTATHMLISYIASLAYYAEQYEGSYDAAELKPMLQYTCRRMDTVKQTMQQPGTTIVKADPFPVSKKLRDLLASRKHELEQHLATDASAIAKQLSIMKTIADQLQLVNAVLEDIIKIQERMGK